MKQRPTEPEADPVTAVMPIAQLPPCPGDLVGARRDRPHHTGAGARSTPTAAADGTSDSAPGADAIGDPAHVADDIRTPTSTRTWTRSRSRTRSARLGCALVLCGVALLPWLFVLATTLPATATASHWPLAWVGLDALEALGLIATGLLAARRDHRRALSAAVTATLLVVDAWFDTVTAAPGGDFVSALAMAAGAELPLAAVCAVVAVRAMPAGGRDAPPSRGGPLPGGGPALPGARV